MLKHHSFVAQTGFSRRRVLGHSMLAAAAVLGACGMKAAGGSVRRRGMVMLDRVPDAPPGLEDAVKFSLVEALIGRRSRRFAMGCSIPDGPLAHTSTHPPMPLGELEQMLVLTAVAGNTGWQNLIPFNQRYLPNIPNYAASAGGRTFPSAAGIHTAEFFFTDDDGTYFLPTRDAPSLNNRDDDGRLDLQDYLASHRSRVRKISDGRLHLPPNAMHMEGHNHWVANCAGSTLVIPVVDLAQHGLANLCYFVQNGVCLFDDITGQPIPGMERFEGLVDVDNPFPLSFAEQVLLTEATAEMATSCYAGALMLQALGLGGWMYGGLNPFSVLGASGDPEVPGLGFRFDTDKRWPLPNVTGLPGVMEGFCPPHFPDMRAAVEALVQRKYGPGGPFHAQTPGPYRHTPRIRSGAAPHDAQFVDCVTTMAQYIYDRFGRFPATMSPIYASLYLQAHHVDTDYYDKHFDPGAYLKTHRDHMKRWHSA